MRKSSQADSVRLQTDIAPQDPPPSGLHPAGWCAVRHISYVKPAGRRVVPAPNYPSQIKEDIGSGSLSSCVMPAQAGVHSSVEATC
jgi:hypothetical protein